MVCHPFYDYLMLIFIYHAATQFRQSFPKQTQWKTFLLFHSILFSNPQKIAFIIITLTPIKKGIESYPVKKINIRPMWLNLLYRILFCYSVSAGTIHIRYPISFNSILINSINVIYKYSINGKEYVSYLVMKWIR